MFNVFRKRGSSQPRDDLTALSDAAVAEVKEKWLVFDHTVRLKDTVSLGQKIDLFAQPVSEFLEKKYPALLLAGSEIFWLTIFTAVLESGTHPKEAVNAAVSELRGKYAGKAQ